MVVAAFGSSSKVTVDYSHFCMVIEYKICMQTNVVKTKPHGFEVAQILCQCFFKTLSRKLVGSFSWCLHCFMYI